MFYNLSQRLQNSCFSFSFQLQPEFYGADAVDKPAYSRSRARKLGRYVRIFPYRHIPDTPFICMQVEIFGEPYISKCFLMNRLVSGCLKTNRQPNTNQKKKKSENTEAENLQIISSNLDLALLLAAHFFVFFSLCGRTIIDSGHSFTKGGGRSELEWG